MNYQCSIETLGLVFKLRNVENEEFKKNIRNVIVVQKLGKDYS